MAGRWFSTAKKQSTRKQFIDYFHSFYILLTRGTYKGSFVQLTRHTATGIRSSWKKYGFSFACLEKRSTLQEVEIPRIY